MYSTLGEIEMAPRRCAPVPGQAREVGQAVESARFTLPDEPRSL